METKKSFIKTTNQRGPYNGKKGPFYTTDIEFTNGDKGQFTHADVTQIDFVPGIEVCYSIEKVINGNYTNYRLKRVEDNGKTMPTIPAGGIVNGLARQGNKRAALQAAAASMSGGKTLFPAQEVIAMAEQFLTWLES